MTTEPNAEEPRNYHSLSYQAIQTLGRAYPLILRAMLLPFVLSVGAVALARMMGAPERYALDGLHGVFVISYLTSVARIAMGAYPGWGFLSLAVPKPSWPGLKPVLGILGEALLVLLPTALFLFVALVYLGSALATALTALDSQVVFVAVQLAPEFILTTLLGLVVGHGMARAATEQRQKD